MRAHLWISVALKLADVMAAVKLSVDPEEPVTGWTDVRVLTATDEKNCADLCHKKLGCNASGFVQHNGACLLAHISQVAKHSWNCKSGGAKSAKKIAIATSCGGMSYCEASMASLATYAKCRGYDFQRWKPSIPEQSSTNFGKYAFINRLFELGGYDWVFWSGGDTAITNLNVKLEHWIEPAEHGQYDMVFAGDLNVVMNADHFLLKNSDWSKDFIAKVLSEVNQTSWDFNDPNSTRGCPEGGPHRWADNSVALWFLGGGNCNLVARRTVTKQEAEEAFSNLPSDTQRHVRILPQRAMNSYDFSAVPDLASSWQPGDFLYHAAGQPKDLVIEHAKQISNTTENTTAKQQLVRREVRSHH